MRGRDALSLSRDIHAPRGESVRRGARRYRDERNALADRCVVVRDCGGAIIVIYDTRWIYMVVCSVLVVESDVGLNLGREI